MASTEKQEAQTHAEAWMPGERGEQVDLGKSSEEVRPGATEVAVPKSDQPQSKVELAAVAKEDKDPVTVGSEESFPASDPPSYQPSKAGQ